jgi:hypothetical protein
MLVEVALREMAARQSPGLPEGNIAGALIAATRTDARKAAGTDAVAVDELRLRPYRVPDAATNNASSTV